MPDQHLGTYVIGAVILAVAAIPWLASWLGRMRSMRLASRLRRLKKQAHSAGRRAAECAAIGLASHAEYHNALAAEYRRQESDLERKLRRMEGQ